MKIIIVVLLNGVNNVVRSVKNVLKTFATDKIKILILNKYFILSQLPYFRYHCLPTLFLLLLSLKHTDLFYRIYFLSIEFH